MVENNGAVLDIPVAGANERRFALWAYHPAPRLNPAHDVGRWRDRIPQKRGHAAAALVINLLHNLDF